MNHRTLFGLVVLLFCTTLLPAFGAAQSITLVPVKAEMLDGSRLVLKDAGCSVDRPNADWRWKTYEGTAQNFLCEHSKTGALLLVSVGALKGDLTDHQPKSLIELAGKTMAGRGGKLEDDKYEWIDLPGVKKCVRVTFNEVDKAGKKTLLVIYIAQTVGQVTLKLQYQGNTPAEPEPFKQMVHSLKMLGEAAAGK